MKKKITKLSGALFVVALMFAGFTSTGQGLAGVDGSCTVSLSCSSNPNDYITCTSTEGECERDAANRSVTCDGQTTEC